MMPQVVPQNPQKLRELAARYRDYERAAAHSRSGPMKS